ncbi:MAG: ribose 5-phosphate isomerase B [Pirellulales bacterium]
MRIAVGSDHRGIELKSQIVAYLQKLGHQTEDAGAFSEESVDYPDIASAVAQRVSSGACERGVLVCGTGIGMSIAANKHPGVRATTCADEATAEICRRHNDVNVICLSGNPAAPGLVERMLAVWLETPFDGGRHARRIEKIKDLERRACS